MSKEQYYVTTRNCLRPNQKCRISIVRGHKIVFKGFEEFQFFAHEPIKGDEWIGSYIISERQTGAEVGYGDSLKAAYMKAAGRLYNEGIIQFRARVAAYKNKLHRKNAKTKTVAA